MKPKKLAAPVDSFGWPLPKPNFRIKPNVLSERIRTIFKQLESRGLSGDSEAMNEFEHLLSLYGMTHQHLLRERAKDGDKLFDGSLSIQELLWLADDTIECLGWLAKKRSKDCEYYAERRLNWPGFISVLASINRKSKEVINYIPLGKKFNHYNRKKTEADILFQVARFAIAYASKPDDSFSGIYFAPFIEGVLWMKRPERDEALKKFASQQGPLTQANWDKWKPVLTRVITLYYGPSWERWKMIPDSPIPAIYLKRERKSKLRLKTYRDMCPAEIFGVMKEWGEHLSKNNKLTRADSAEIKTWVTRQNKNRRCIMDIEPDEALKKIHARVALRDGGWGDFKSEILNRCKRLLPKN